MARTVWPWRQPPASAEPRAEPGKLRLRGLIQAAVGLAVALAFYSFDKTVLAAVAGSLASITGLAALLSPTGAYAALSRGFEVLGRWIGRLLTVLTLVPLFFFFFLPFGLLARRGRRDKLERWFDSGAETYWHDREPRPDGLSGFQRQF